MGDLDDIARAAQARQKQPVVLPPGTAPQFPAYAVPQSAVPVPTGTERVWMVHDRGAQYGPHTEAELATLVAVGTISPTAMVWREGSPRWTPISAVVPMPAYLPTAPANTPASSNRIGIGLCAIFLGWLGIHKFMLGFSTAGVVMLLVGVLGGCFYGLGAIVMGIIGLIEGIIYLCKTDAQFHQDYVVNKRQWF